MARLGGWDRQRPPDGKFLVRVKTNAEKKRQAKADGTTVFLKRQADKPREARTVSATDNKPESIAPIAYDTHI